MEKQITLKVTEDKFIFNRLSVSILKALVNNKIVIVMTSLIIKTSFKLFKK